MSWYPMILYFFPLEQEPLTEEPCSEENNALAKEQKNC